MTAAAKRMFEFERDYWNQRYLNHDPRGSGGGSYGEPMWRKADALIALPDVTSIVEIGTGDFNFGKYLTDKMPTVKYDGYDVSDVVIERNQRNFKTSSPRIEFHEFDPPMRFPEASLLLCIDVLFHITKDSEYEDMLDMLAWIWNDCRYDYLAVTAYEYDGPSDAHVRIRKFDPSRFGVPILREVIEDEGEMIFYIFKR